MGRPPDEKPAFGYFWFSDYEGGTRIRYFQRLAEQKGLDYLRAEGVWFVFWRRCIHSPKPGYPYQPNGKRMTTECWASEWRVPLCDAVVWIECLLSAGCAKRQQGGLLYMPNPAKSLCPKHLRKYGFVSPDEDTGGFLDAKTIPKLASDPVRSDPVRTEPNRSDPKEKTPLPPKGDGEVPKEIRQFIAATWITGKPDLEQAVPGWVSDGHPIEWIGAAIRKGVESGGTGIGAPYIGGILRRYSRQGGPDDRKGKGAPSRDAHAELLEKFRSFNAEEIAKEEADEQT